MRNVFVYGKDWACVCVCVWVWGAYVYFWRRYGGYLSVFFFCSFSMFKILLPFSLILICAVWVFVSFPESCVQGRVPYTSYEQLLMQTVFIFKPTNVHIYQSFPGLCVIPIHTHIQCQVAALTCLWLNTRLEQVPHQALIHTVSAADWNRPVAYHTMLALSCTTNDCIMQRQLHETLHAVSAVLQPQTWKHLVVAVGNFTNIPLIIK